MATNQALSMEILTALLLVGAVAEYVDGHERPSRDDILRAARWVPRPAFLGESFEHSSRLLNAVTQSRFGGRARPCHEFTPETLWNTQDRIRLLRSDKLMAMYNTTDRRGEVAARDIGNVRANVMEIAALLRETNITQRIIRDALCAETLMQWTHQITEQSRRILLQESDFFIPLLSETDHRNTDVQQNTDQKHALQFYQSKISCATCHVDSAPPQSSSKAWPNWPDRLEYSGRHYGDFPWWCQESPVAPSGGKQPMNWTCNSRNLTFEASHLRTVRYSAQPRWEQAVHSRCRLSQFGGPDERPCTHLFVRGAGLNGSVIFESDANGTPRPGGFCCNATRLAAPRPDFFTSFPNVTQLERYTTPYYQGPAVNYSVYIHSGGVVAKNGNRFWFITDDVGRPVEFGEGCEQSHDGQACPGADHHAITYWHFNVSSLYVPEKPTPLPMVQCSVWRREVFLAVELGQAVDQNLRKYCECNVFQQG